MQMSIPVMSPGKHIISITTDTNPHATYVFHTSFPPDNILQPSFGAGLLQPLSAQSNATVGDAAAAAATAKQSPTSSVAVGSTWSNTSIDLDNLMSGKSKSTGPVMSMNQLKHQSPVKTTASNGQSLSGMAPPFQANLIGATSPTLVAAPQYSNIPMVATTNNATARSQPQQQLFGNLVSNQFNAFQ